MQTNTLADGQPLSRRLMLFYGFPDLTHAVVALPMALFIPSYYSPFAHFFLWLIKLKNTIYSVFKINRKTNCYLNDDLKRNILGPMSKNYILKLKAGVIFGFLPWKHSKSFELPKK